MGVSIFISVILTLILTAPIVASEPSSRLGTANQAALKIYEASSVVEDPTDQILTSSTIAALGDFKYPLEGSLQVSRGQSATTGTLMKVVKDALTGRIGLTSGHLIVEYVEGESGPDLALSYGLAVISQLPSLNRIVVQLGDLGEFEQVKESMRLDDRVVSTELEIYYGGYKAQ